MMFRYLLDAETMPAPEVERFEDEYFGVDETFALLLAAEDELIDSYLGGEMNPRDRERFENHFLLSPRRRQKVENARAMRRVIPEFAVSERSRPEPATIRRPLFSRILSRLYEPKSLPAVSIAMATLLIAVGAASVFKIRQSSRALDQARKEQTTLERQIADAREESGLLAERLQRANDRLANLNSGQTESSPSDGAPSTIISSHVLNLVPGNRNRDDGETMKLKIPSKADVARLQVMAPAPEYRSYQAELKTVGSDLALWRQRRLQARRTKTREAVIDLWLPADILARGDYILELSGITSRGQPESLPPYTFTIERK